jgi:hypothetical protein
MRMRGVARCALRRTRALVVAPVGASTAGPADGAGNGGLSAALRGVTAVAVVALSFLLSAALARASYEQVKQFLPPPPGEEGALFGPPLGVAVDYKSGDVYIADKNGERVMRYGPEGEFLEAWGWGVAHPLEENRLQTCGKRAFEKKEAEYETCGTPETSVTQGIRGEGPGEFETPMGMAVDQTTGNVYVTDDERKSGVVQEFSPDGRLIAGFGSRGAFREPVSKSPGLIHEVKSGDIAVDSAGVVYLADSNQGSEGRVMVWRPGRGGDEEYGYAGQYEDRALTQAKIVLDSSGDLYAVEGEGEEVYKFAAGDLVAPFGVLAAPACTFHFSTGGIAALSVNPGTGEVFFFTFKENGQYYRVEPCKTVKEEAEKVEEKFAGPFEGGVVFNPLASVKAGLLLGLVRPLGALYTGGWIFAQPVALPPSVESESVGGVRASSASLSAAVNPHGYQTYYGFQYLTDAAYRANDPDARQTVTVSATGGVFTLGFGGQSTGGGGTGSLSAGSPVVGSLVTAAGSGNLSAATGTGALKKSEAVVEALKTTSTGAFAVGQTISGTGIPAGTTIVKVEATKLTLSQAATATGAKVALSAGSEEVTGLTTTLGRFVAGQPLSGVGVPVGARITAVGSGTLTLSAPVTVAGAGVALSSAGPLPFAVGQEIAGAGIPAGTTVAAVGSGTLTLSAPAMASASGVVLASGLPFDASAEEVRGALDGLSSIGGVGGSVEVSGGPGDASGSSPYVVTFTGGFGDTGVASLASEAGSLSGGAKSALVAVANAGGDGFKGASSAPLVVLKEPGDVAAETLSALEPDTTYHYRVRVTHCTPAEQVAEGEKCFVRGAGQTLHTFPAGIPRLPDERAYELVSPPGKGEGQVFPNNPAESEPGGIISQGEPMPRVSAADGDAVVYEGGPFSAGGGATVTDGYLATRTVAGWQTRDLSPAVGTGQPGYRAYSADLSRGVFVQAGSEPSLCPEAPVGYAELYMLGGGCEGQPGFQPLLTSAPPHRPAAFFNLAFEGASDDLSHVVFGANDSLIPGEGKLEKELAEDVKLEVEHHPEENHSYLYDWAGGQLSLVDVLENGAVAPNAVLGGGENNGGVVSGDGSRVFWSVPSGPDAGLYVRVSDERTVKVPDPHYPSARFLTASADGSRVLLTDGRIYELVEEGGALKEVWIEDLTAGHGGFEGILGSSEDLSSVYFVDTAALTPEAEQNEYGAHAEAGQDNLYLRHEEGATTFIATLSGGDKQFDIGAGDWTISPTNRGAQASPDGRYVAFLSVASLTGYENAGNREVFEYDSGSGRIACVSCSPTGERPATFISNTGKSEPVEANLGEFGSAGRYAPQSRYLSDGGRLFFDSPEALSPYDTNELQKVYEFEPEGLGSCARAQREGGCVYLISSGHGNGNEGARLITTDPTGENIFFTTRDQLVPEDQDDQVDLYDARVKGGFAHVSAARCTEAGCQGVPQTQPIFATPPSATFTGVGNFAAPASEPPVKPKPKQKTIKCAKGKKLSHGKCVKAKKARKAAKKAKRARRSDHQSAINRGGGR